MRIQQAVDTPQQKCYVLVMPKKNDLNALRNIIAEAQDIVNTTVLPEGRSGRLKELMASAIFLTDHMLEESPAAALGKKGGQSTAKRGPDYFRKIASQRKTRAGGRPKKSVN